MIKLYFFAYCLWESSGRTEGKKIRKESKNMKKLIYMKILLLNYWKLAKTQQVLQ